MMAATHVHAKQVVLWYAPTILFLAAVLIMDNLFALDKKFLRTHATNAFVRLMVK